MAQFNKAIPIVIVALMLTGLCGYLLQSEHTISETTRYDYKGNLNPSVQYSQIDDWTEYNPLRNVTGWKFISENADVPILAPGLANQYVLTPVTLDYTEFTSTAQPLHSIQNDTSLGLNDLNRFLRLNNTNLAITTQGPGMNFAIDKYTQTNTGLYNVGELPYNLIYEYPRDNTINNDYLLYGGLDLHTTFRSGTPTYSTDTIFTTYLNYYTESGGLIASYNNGGGLFTTNTECSVIPITWFNYPNISNNTVIHTGKVWYLKEETINTRYSFGSGLQSYQGYVTTELTMNCYETNVTDWILDTSSNSVYPAVEIDGVWEKVSGSQPIPRERLVYEYKNSYHTNDPEPALPTPPTYEVPIVKPTQYVDPYQMVTINEGKYIRWTNEETNGIIRVLTTANNEFQVGTFTAKCPDNLPYDYYLATLDFVNKSFTCQGVTSFVNTQAYTVADYHYNMITSGDIPESATEIRINNVGIPVNVYPMYEISYTQSSTGTTIVQRVEVTVFNEDGTTDTKWIQTTRTMSITLTFNVSGMGTVTYSSPLFNELTFTALDGTVYSNVPVDNNKVAWIGHEIEYTQSKVFIDSTVVAVDPLGILWGNPAMYLNYYFPDQMNDDSRVLFNGFVKEGQSMTINGQTFQIVNGAIQHYDSGQDIVLNLPIKGMAVDYIHRADGVHVSLMFTEYSNYVIDLGKLDETPITVPGTSTTVPEGYVISASGTWYWQSAVYDITITTEERVGLDIASGVFALSWTAACLLMIFFIVVSSAVWLYVVHQEFEFMEWVTLMVSVTILLLMGAIL